MSNEEEYLLISGIEHYLHCPRQWALIHLEDQWQENYLTADGRVMHKRAHNEQLRELRGDILTVRGLHIKSDRLQIQGVCDVVEYHRSPDGIQLTHTDGNWHPYPVEYKRGSRTVNDCARAQLCAQAICLEEMHQCTIEQGAVYYGQEGRREVVQFTPQLRELVSSTLDAMRQLYRSAKTPPAKDEPSCRSCSMVELCLPKLVELREVAKYLDEDLGRE